MVVRIHWIHLIPSSIFPQRRKLLGSSAHEVPEKVWEALVQSQVSSNRLPEKVSGEGLRCFQRLASQPVAAVGDSTEASLESQFLE